MSISSTSSNVSSSEDDFTVNTPRRFGQLLKRTFVHLETRLPRPPTRVHVEKTEYLIFLLQEIQRN